MCVEDEPRKPGYGFSPRAVPPCFPRGSPLLSPTAAHHASAAGFWEPCGSGEDGLARVPRRGHALGLGLWGPVLSHCEADC